MVQDTYKVVNLNGTTSYVNIPTHVSLTPNADYMTVEARMYIDINRSYNRYGGIVAKSNGSSDNLGWLLYYTDIRPGDVRRLGFSIFHAALDIGTVSLNNAISESGWYHVVATYDRTLGSDNMKLFINGMRVAVANYTQTVTYTAVRNATVGSLVGGTYPLWVQ